MTWTEIDAAAAARQRLGLDPPPPDPLAGHPWCVFVSGSRDLRWSHEALIREELQPFVAQHSAVIHGLGQGRKSYIPGCDYIVARAAPEMGFNVIGIPALWELHDKGAGPIRNRLCIDTLLLFGKYRYRMAMLGFSTGGPGTEGALELMRRLYDRDNANVLIKKISITL